MEKYLNLTGLVYLWARFKAFVTNYVKVVNGKVIIGENEISVPTNVSDLTNDSGFITASDIPEGASASNTTPEMDGIAAVGAETAFARGDHRHPTDTSRQAVISDLSDIRSGASAGATAYQLPSGGIPKTDLASAVQTSLGKADTAMQSGDLPIATTTTPKMNGTAAVGSETKWAKGDHIHPSDTTKVDKTTTVNGHALSSNVTVTKSDVSLGNVTNDAQVKRTEMGVANGVATLDSSGKVPSSQLPSFVDDVKEVFPVPNQTELSQNWLTESDEDGGTPLVPQAGVIYILMVATTNYDENTQFRWGGTTYVKIADSGASAITTSEIDTITSDSNNQEEPEEPEE